MAEIYQRGLDDARGAVEKAVIDALRKDAQCLTPTSLARTGMEDPRYSKGYCTGFQEGLSSAINVLEELSHKPGAHIEHYISAIKHLKNPQSKDNFTDTIDKSWDKGYNKGVVDSYNEIRTMINKPGEQYLKAISLLKTFDDWESKEDSVYD